MSGGYVLDPAVVCSFVFFAIGLSPADQVPSFLSSPPQVSSALRPLSVDLDWTGLDWTRQIWLSGLWARYERL